MRHVRFAHLPHCPVSPLAQIGELGDIGGGWGAVGLRHSGGIVVFRLKTQREGWTTLALC